ncbi:GNAT family protein [Phenylobacterium sp.]|uniref:GNAT family N-acetyltransferase n=1 Tax=Phenylobacterium sp. TaxID=1871053 RepID=UPI002ED8B2AB
MQLEARVLENRFVRMEPMEERHKEELRAACAADPATWQDLYIVSMLGEAFERHWARFSGPGDGKMMTFALVVDGVCRGMSSYLDIEPAHNTVEIGFTYYEPAFRGGVANPSAKRLMMAHAFESGAERVQYRVDAANARSRAAVLKLGAVQEGILRNDKVTWTGRIRSTVVFSILAEEWPAVRDRLDERIAAFG